MDFEQLLSLQDILDIQLINGELTWLQYEREFMSLLRATGYSLRDYEEGIDRRWDYIAALRCIAPRGLA
jgi:hypothetical protein